MARLKLVRVKIPVRLALFSIAIALLLAGLFFIGGAASPVQQVGVSPTPDRLARPTLPDSPTQADRGAQVYWLSCLPCHGDRGQGLTDEFRQAYPPEDRNCWDSGCHGARPYDNGFKLPPAIPAVIGPGALQKFSNAGVLEAYIKAAMPFWKPGSLTEEDAWQVTAFLLRENGFWAGDVELDAANASQIQLQLGGVFPSPGMDDAPRSLSFWKVVFAIGLLTIFLIVMLFRLRLKQG